MDKYCIMLVGFKEKPMLEDMVVLNYTPEANVALSAKERIHLIEKGLDMADVVITNFNNGTTSIDELVLLQLAYTKTTPILGVGKPVQNVFLDEMVANWFDTIDDAVEHFLTYYIIK